MLADVCASVAASTKITRYIGYGGQVFFLPLVHRLGSFVFISFHYFVTCQALYILDRRLAHKQGTGSTDVMHLGSMALFMAQELVSKPSTYVMRAGRSRLTYGRR